MSDQLRWLVFGAGAIGTYVGGSLLLRQPGARVVFVERPDVADRVRQRGLRMNLAGEENVFPSLKIYGSIESALAENTFDIAVFALKSFDTASALESYRPVVTKLPTFLCLSNGVENEPNLAKVLGAERVIQGTITASVGRRDAGDVVVERRRGLGVAGGHPLSARVVEALNTAGLNTRLYPDGLSMKWSKMLTNLTTNASAAILDLPPSAIYANLNLYEIEMRMLREALAVMRALKLSAVNLPGVPASLISFGALLPPAISRPLFASQASQGRGNKMPSFHIDLHAGRSQSEVDYLNGAVVRFGRQLGIPTPVNQTLNETLLRLTRREIPLDRYSGDLKAYLALFRK